MGDRARRALATMRAHEHRAAAALFALLVLVYLWPALVGGGVLSPAALLYGFAPWNSMEPPGGLAHLNVILSDVPTSYYPWDALARDLLHDGTFPAWNPYAYGGTPFFANLSVAWLSPFSLPLWTLPLNYAVGVAAALKLWVAAFGTYLLVRELRLGFCAGIVAGASFSLCAFDVVWLSHGAHVSVAVLLPWLIWLTERIVRRGGRAEGVALAGVVGCALAGGHPGTQVHVLAATILYALVRLATTRELDRGERGRRLATVGGGLVVGALLLAVVLLPGERASVETVGAEVRRSGDTVTLIGETLPFKALLAAVFPDWWGRPSEEGLVAGPANYNERAFYAGGLALMLAAVALVSPGAWRRKAAFLPLLALGLAIPLNAPLIRSLVVGLPAFDRVQNQRMLLWFGFAVAVLAGFGVQAILDAGRRQARAWAVLGAATAGGLAAIAAIDREPGDVGGAWHHLVDRFAGQTTGALALSSVLRWLLLVAVAAAALVLLRARPRRAQLVGGLLALVAALDVLLFANAYQPIGPASMTIPPATPGIAYLQQRSGDGRIAGIGNVIPADWSTMYRLHDVRGYDAPQPSLRFFRLWTALNEQQVSWQSFAIADLPPEGPTVLGLLGARWIAAAPGSTLPDDPAYGALRPVYEGEDLTVFENALAAPRAVVPARVHAAEDEDAELATVTTPDFDARRDAVARDEDVPAAGAGTARVTAEENARVVLHASLPRRGLVVLNDAWAPGWSVAVDGRPAEAIEANVVMRGVVAPAGEHEIVWSYRVPGLRLGALLSAVGLALLLGWAGVLVARARRAAR